MVGYQKRRHVVGTTHKVTFISVRVAEKQQGTRKVKPIWILLKQETLPSEARRGHSGGRVLGRGQLALSTSEGFMGSVVSSRGGVLGRVPAAQRFPCTSTSPGSLFFRVINVKQLQKSFLRPGRRGGGCTNPIGSEIRPT